MCRLCRCPEICDCNTSCCFGFVIPIDLGYFFCSLWILFNGFVFPLLSVVFWSKYYIFYASCCICLVNSIFSFVSFVNMQLKRHSLFNAVLYGIFATYVAGGLVTTVAVNIGIDDNKLLLMESFRTLFGVTLSKPTAFVILQATQIVFYAYLFVSYVYCGFILQLYEIKRGRKYKKRTAGISY